MSVPFKKTGFTLLVIFIFSLITVFILLANLNADEVPEGQGNRNAVPVKIIRAEKGRLSKTLRLNGYIESDNIVTVTPLVSGTLKEIIVELGDKVEQDQVIARIDSRIYDLQLKQAEAAYLSAESTYKRLLQLYESNAATRSSLEQSKSQYEAYKSQLELAELQVSYTKITAPIAGTVLMLHGNMGSMAAPELPLVTIGDLSNLIVKIDIPEKYYEIFRTAKDMNIQILRPQSGRPPYDAEILTVSPVINAETKNFKTTCHIKGDLSALRPGMFVYCDFELDSLSKAYYLPHITLGPGNSLWYVDPESPTARKAELPEIFSNADYFVIPDDMSSLDFIIEGQSFLQPGRNIIIR